MREASVAIVGAGVSGLATAYFLGQQGIRSVVIEKSNRVGGLIRTDHLHGCILESGPDSYLASKPAVTELCSELPGMSEQIIGSNDAARRVFVVRDSKLVAMPRGMVMIAPSDWPAALRSPLFSAQTKLRLLSETLWRPLIRNEDFTVGELVTDHFGSELLDYVAEPLLAGVYGGNSASLSAPSVLPRFVGYERRFGSLIRGVREERQKEGRTSLFHSFREGMQTLTDALARYALVHQATAEHVERDEGSWRVHCGAESLIVADAVLACPAHAAARLIEAACPALARELDAIPYSSAILSTLLFERSKIAHPLDGFGFLVPQRERHSIAAATWVGTKFPTRIRPDLVGLRAFIVAENAKRLRDARDEELMELVRSDLARFMGIDAEPCFAATQRWPDSMPQYVVGHQQRAGAIRAALRELPGLHVIGNAYEGVGISDCIRLAKETAKCIQTRKAGRAAASAES